MESSKILDTISDENHRVITPLQTCEQARALLEKLGINDIRDITDYNSLGIPVWSVHQSDKTGFRTIGYGKGISSIHSQASAMMEAIEHYSAENLPANIKRATYREMTQQENVIELRAFTRTNYSTFLEDMVFDWLPGVELFTKERIWVPARCVLLCPTINGEHILPKNTSNGLASGNVIEEAVFHALCELIERDAWTIAWLRTVMIPYIRIMAHKIIYHSQEHNKNHKTFIEDINLFPEIDIASIPKDIQQLTMQFEHSGMTILIRDITSDIEIPTFLAISQNTNNKNPHNIYYGTGSHPNARIAIIRAITECAQSRLVDMQDHKPNKRQFYSSEDMEICQQNMFSSKYNHTKKHFSSISTYNNRDIPQNITHILQQLSSVGLKQVITVDITLPRIGLPVIRALIPGIEDWSAFHFSSHQYKLGTRCRRYIKKDQFDEKTL